MEEVHGTVENQEMDVQMLPKNIERVVATESMLECSELTQGNLKDIIDSE